MTPPESVVASVVITTRNRADTLRRALLSCRMQTGVPFEVVVFDDASEDHTESLVRDEFPEVRYFRNERPAGYIVLRNRGYREARGQFVFSIDDDAWFSAPDVLSTVVTRFGTQPDAAGFALRFVEPNRRADQGFMKPTPDNEVLRTFVGCAHALRRELVLKCGGYREYLIHQGEERDLSLRLMSDGHTIRFLNSPAIVHEPSQQRDHSALRYLGLRNTFLFDVVNVPLPDVLLRLPADVVLLARHRISWSVLPRRMAHIVRGLIVSLWFVTKRRAVSRDVWRRFRSLPRHGAMHVGTLPAGQRDPEGRPVRKDSDD